ncbi:hypothetical protein PPERSA_01102 [Pseudocohnilembus persalinus]|uniref:Rad1/Rec1/Rad17 n=1 Tax=Pseudocohnilembus persalinus TaxID=266149 RepID=A0A0V0QVR1_PSEPJ|nr:hypothetical protein PPERSA_01102 [Pseudocohnilembus persalinus]|eukprot:KRX06024.1 hypothetical protein PPERSA_01102 [Pseudocohnilembus persalinus]
MFGNLAKYAGKNQLDFHILVNLSSISFIIKKRGNITSTVLQLKRDFFKKINFQENMSNTASGYVMKVNMEDFDLSYKLLDPGNENMINIEYEKDCSYLMIRQSKKQQNNPSFQCDTQKTIKLDILDEEQVDKDSISMSFIPNQDYLISLEFTSGSSFNLVDKVFSQIKETCLTFVFDFSILNNQQVEVNCVPNNVVNESFKVSMTNFKKIKGDYQKYQYDYYTKLILPAFSFMNKETNVSMKINHDGALFLISRDENANIQTETIIPMLENTID